MALRNQPYLPLYVRDYLTNQKLNMCSATSQGIYVKIMCQMHRSDEYGTILLKQNNKQSQSTYSNFAYVLAKLLPFDKDELKLAIQELVEEGVLYIENDKLCQKRMIHDNKISELRANAGSKGGKKTQSFAKAKPQAHIRAKIKQNTANANASKIINIDFEKFWNLYDKKVSKKKSINLWNKLTDDERSLIIDYIPKYKEAQTDKTFRKNPDGFLLNRGWEDEIVIKQPVDNRVTHTQKRINHYVYKCPSCNKEYRPRVMKGEDDFDAYRCDENPCQKIGLGKDGKNMVGYQLEFIKQVYKEES